MHGRGASDLGRDRTGRDRYRRQNTGRAGLARPPNRPARPVAQARGSRGVANMTKIKTHRALVHVSPHTGEANVLISVGTPELGVYAEDIVHHGGDGDGLRAVIVISRAPTDAEIAAFAAGRLAGRLWPDGEDAAPEDTEIADLRRQLDSATATAGIHRTRLLDQEQW